MTGTTTPAAPGDSTDGSSSVVATDTPVPAAVATDPSATQVSDPSQDTSGSSAATATDTAAAAAASAATTAATTQPQTATPASPPDPVAAAAAGALAALLDIAGDCDEEAEDRIDACRAIKEFCDDSTVHALIDSIPQMPPSS